MRREAVQEERLDEQREEPVREEEYHNRHVVYPQQIMVVLMIRQNGFARTAIARVQSPEEQENT